MKTVVIGNSSSVFLKDYIKGVCLKIFDEIIFLSVSIGDWDYYKKLGVKLFYTGSCLIELEMSEQDRKDEERRRRDEICDRIHDIDVLQVHYCHGGARMYCYKKLIKESRIKYMIYWGSDIMRSDQENLELNRNAIEDTDKVICMTESLQRALILNYGRKIQNKIEILDFGVIYADIKDAILTHDRIYYKRKIGFPDDKISIMIGYNGASAQQHLAVINAIKKLKRDTKINIFLFLPMSYGSSEEYRNEVEIKLKETRITYTIIDRFLNREEIVFLRAATDVFIHAQITDALSTSLCECLYAGAEVLNPSWIKYPELVENKIPFHEYQDFDELVSILEDVLLTNQNKEKVPEYAERLWKLNERESLYRRWSQLMVA